MIQDRTRDKDTPTRQQGRHQWTIALLLTLLFCLSGINAVAATQGSDPLRWHKEIKRFAWQDAKNSYPEQAILFIGSSSIYSWKTAQAFPQPTHYQSWSEWIPHIRYDLLFSTLGQAVQSG